MSRVRKRVQGWKAQSKQMFGCRQAGKLLVMKQDIEKVIKRLFWFVTCCFRSKPITKRAPLLEGTT